MLRRKVLDSSNRRGGLDENERHDAKSMRNYYATHTQPRSGHPLVLLSTSGGVLYRAPPTSSPALPTLAHGGGFPSRVLCCCYCITVLFDEKCCVRRSRVSRVVVFLLRRNETDLPKLIFATTQAAKPKRRGSLRAALLFCCCCCCSSLQRLLRF